VCGIIALVRGPGPRQVLAASHVADRLDEVARGLTAASDRVAAARTVAGLLEDLDAELGSGDGIALLVRDRDLATLVAGTCLEVGAWIDAAEADLDRDGVAGGHSLEEANAALLALKDAWWAVARDRLPTAAGVRDLVGPSPSWSAIEVATSVQQALSALDRLEVRGRDSAGLTVLVRDHGLDLDEPAVAAMVESRSADPLFRSLAVRTAEGHLSFVYKAAAEIGELGDNTRALRAAIAGDDLLHLALAADTASALVLGHTRWASVGIISQPNAHPLDSIELDRVDGPLMTRSAEWCQVRSTVFEGVGSAHAQRN
jgi:glucosamine--fructose-6-phosphate aminotransferase (isomerizing)